MQKYNPLVVTSSSLVTGSVMDLASCFDNGFQLHTDPNKKLSTICPEKKILS